MSTDRLQLTADLWLDARRAAWLPDTRVLVVADLHLGYAWAQRVRGQLLPVGVPDDTLPRLLELCADYAPRELVVAGDVVHRAVPVPALAAEIRELLARVGELGIAVTLVAGNHDRDLGGLLARQPSAAALVTEAVAGPHLVVHGDDRTDVRVEAEQLQKSARAAGRILMGHEHPAIVLGDGVATSLKCPCFLVSQEVLVLPAFSGWAAGCTVGRQPFLSALARGAAFTQAVAVMGGKLLPVRL